MMGGYIWITCAKSDQMRNVVIVFTVTLHSKWAIARVVPGHILALSMTWVSLPVLLALVDVYVMQKRNRTIISIHGKNTLNRTVQGFLDG